MTSDIERRRELLGRVTDANRRIRALDERLASADNVIRFRMTRHVQTVTELASDIDARSIEMPPADTEDRRQFERDLAALEDEISFAEAKLEAAGADEREDASDELRANMRAAPAQASALRDEIGGPTKKE
jgi:hypothetical protein